MIKAAFCQKKWPSGDVLRVFMDQAGICVAQDPVAEPCDTGINPRPVDLSTAHTPTHHPSQEEPPWSTLAYQGASRVTLQKKAQEVNSDPVI